MKILSLSPVNLDNALENQDQLKDQDQNEDTVPSLEIKNLIRVTIITLGGVPVTNLNVDRDLTTIKIEANISDDMVRFSGISTATVMLFEDLTDNEQHSHTIMQGEHSKIAIVSYSGLIALTKVSSTEFNDSNIVDILKRTISYWITRF